MSRGLLNQVFPRFDAKRFAPLAEVVERVAEGIVVPGGMRPRMRRVWVAARVSEAVAIGGGESDFVAWVQLADDGSRREVPAQAWRAGWVALDGDGLVLSEDAPEDLGFVAAPGVVLVERSQMDAWLSGEPDVAVVEPLSVPVESRYPRGLLKPADAARFLNTSERTLRRWRRDGGGPAYVRKGGSRGPVHYRIADLNAWADDNARENTSQEP